MRMIDLLVQVFQFSHLILAFNLALGGNLKRFDGILSIADNAAYGC